MTREVSPWIKLALSAGGLCVALALAEVAVRLLGAAPAVQRMRADRPHSAYTASKNPVLGYELKAGYRGKDPDLHESFPSINSHGQRDIERTLVKAPGVRRVLLLGDSVVVGHGLKNLDHTISRQMERYLRGHKVEVLNFGVGGYCTRSEVELLKVKGLRFSPDAVIFVFSVDDNMDYNRQVARYGVHRPAWAELAFVHGHLFRLLSMEFDLFGFRAETDPKMMVRRQRDAIGDSGLEKGIALLGKLQRRHGFKLAVTVWPMFRDDAVDDLRNDDTIRWARDAFKKQGIQMTYLGPAFERDHTRHRAAGDPRSPNRRYTTGDQTHPNPTGAAVAAHALSQVVIRMLRVERGTGNGERGTE